MLKMASWTCLKPSLRVLEARASKPTASVVERPLAPGVMPQPASRVIAAETASRVERALV
ncbi:hypothetical protein D3C87_1651110 [compost metagenome]